MSDHSRSPDVLRRGAVFIVTRLRTAGFEAYLVGGPVRDRLLGRRIKDYDIATDATPDQVMGLFRKTVPVGVAFGVVMVLVHEGEYEVTTFRAEADYTDGRRPDTIRFVSAKEDVLRRDFTINGLLEDPDTGEIRDFVEGRKDLSARLIRAIGDPRERFQEDHLRILRAIRFAAVLGFDIEARTFEAILEMAPNVAGVAAERVRNELSRAFTEGDPARAYTLLALSGVLEVVLPEASWLGSRVGATLQAMGSAPFPVVLAAMLGDLTPAQGVEVARRLRMSKQERVQLEYLLTSRLLLEGLTTRAQTVRFIREDGWPFLANLVEAERIARGESIDAIEALVVLRESLTPEQLRPTRLLTGRDLQALGHQPGRHFKTILDALEDAQIEGRVTTRQEAEAFIQSL